MTRPRCGAKGENDRAGRDRFFWSLPEQLAPDQQLVTLLSAGRFNALMKQDDEASAWVERVVRASHEA